MSTGLPEALLIRRHSGRPHVRQVPHSSLEVRRIRVRLPPKPVPTAPNTIKNRLETSKNASKRLRKRLRERPNGLEHHVPHHALLLRHCLEELPRLYELAPCRQRIQALQRHGERPKGKRPVPLHLLPRILYKP